jgi:tetratricopeptide (TPR) repeat protein
VESVRKNWLAVAVLPLYGYGTYLRNQVWYSEETLWHDVTLKSPRNGRGLMNYGLTQMALGRYPIALYYFEQAHNFTPNYDTLEINLGIVKGALNRDVEAEQHFSRALALAPQSAQPHFYYGRWLNSKGRTQEAINTLKLGIAKYDRDFESRYLLMEIFANQHDIKALQALADETLRLLPDDARSLEFKMQAK